jgi:hypothetical protein
MIALFESLTTDGYSFGRVCYRFCELAGLSMKEHPVRSTLHYAGGLTLNNFITGGMGPMETNGQNLGGYERDDAELGRLTRMINSQRHAIETLSATVRKLELENDALLEGCKYGVKYLTEAFGPESSITRTLALLVESKIAGAT